ncbi:MAG TPA: ABC transporter ATP-binding protein [Pseudonocardiaceae bacterium]|jgi:multiple sugar transport system ATP-binding protein|nr:ABC transporter ATP-binding protein [Pseudonocardiaceae bacterium]
MSRIQLDGLTKRFGPVTGVDEVSLDVADGDFLVLLGPSGCGKSTLLRMIAGLVEPTEGRVLVDNRDVTCTPPRDRDLAMVFQSYALYPHLSVERNITFPLRARRRPRAEIKQQLDEVANVLDLTELLRRKPKELSGGQRQRVALGRALVRDPGAFLMDEPLSNLDAKLRTATRASLSALHRRLGSTFVYVTHDQVEAMTMATRIAVLNGGRLEQLGTPAEVYDEPASVFVAGFLGSPAMNLINATVESVAGRLRVRAAGVDVPLWSGSLPAREVVLGIRPENLLRVDPATAMIRATVELVENLGSEEIACLTTDQGDSTLALRGPRPLGLTPGTAVGLDVAATDVHLFDAAGGRRLAWQEAPAAVTVAGTVTPTVIPTVTAGRSESTPVSPTDAVLDPTAV